MLLKYKIIYGIMTFGKNQLYYKVKLTAVPVMNPFFEEIWRKS